MKQTFLGSLTLQTKGLFVFSLLFFAIKSLLLSQKTLKPGNEVEELGLADGMFFAPLTIEGPEEANGKAADTWPWWCLGW